MDSNKHQIYIEDDVLRDLEQDTFGHKHIATAVVNSIINTKPPFIIGIFGGWGTGKSSLLGIINSNLPKDKVVTVTIDAWRYSSNENLRRAFLVHVAKELTPKLLDDLRRRLYTSEQETRPERPSKFDTSNKSIKDQILDFFITTFKFAITFIGLCILFYFFLFIFTLLSSPQNYIYIQSHGFQELLVKFDWDRLLNRFLDLVFIPLLLVLVNYLRLDIIQHPVTIIQERIDADELFSEYFEKIVKEATKKIISRKRLAIFIDNLSKPS